MGRVAYLMRGNWWVVLVALLSISFYWRALEKKNSLVEQLQAKLVLLKQERLEVLERRENLLLRLQSFEDPDWVEVVLMEKLGVVAEGQRKVVFE